MAAKRPRQGIQRTKVSFVIVVFSTCAIVPLFVIFRARLCPDSNKGRLLWQHWTASSRFSSAEKERRTARSAFRTNSAFLAGDTSATPCSSYALIDASALSSFGHPVRCAVTVATYLRAGEHVPTRYSYGLSAFLPSMASHLFHDKAPSGALLFCVRAPCAAISAPDVTAQAL